MGCYRPLLMTVTGGNQSRLDLAPVADLRLSHPLSWIMIPQIVHAQRRNLCYLSDIRLETMYSAVYTITNGSANPQAGYPISDDRV